VITEEIEKLHQEVTSRGYKYNSPAITTAPWGDRVMEVIDPFSNKILFNEQVSSSASAPVE
jgi:hypothetical protein